MYMYIYIDCFLFISECFAPFLNMIIKYQYKYMYSFNIKIYVNKWIKIKLK